MSYEVKQSKGKNQYFLMDGIKIIRVFISRKGALDALDKMRASKSTPKVSANASIVKKREVK